jgi:hypothetical protein
MTSHGATSPGPHVAPGSPLQCRKEAHGIHSVSQCDFQTLAHLLI